MNTTASVSIGWHFGIPAVHTIDNEPLARLCMVLLSLSNGLSGRSRILLAVVSSGGLVALCTSLNCRLVAARRRAACVRCLSPSSRSSECSVPVPPLQWRHGWSYQVVGWTCTTHAISSNSGICLCPSLFRFQIQTTISSSHHPASISTNTPSHQQRSWKY